MSALPPKADICSAPAHVRYGPEADIPLVYSITSSARPRSDSGTVSPSTLAVLRFRISSTWSLAAPAGRRASRPLESGRCRRQPGGMHLQHCLRSWRTKFGEDAWSLLEEWREPVSMSALGVSDQTRCRPAKVFKHFGYARQCWGAINASHNRAGERRLISRCSNG